MQYFPNHGNGLHRVIYVSQAKSDGMPEDVISDIATKAASNNAAVAVTGVLLSYNGWFVQALEGSHDVVKPLFERIAQDPRHHKVTLKSVDGVDARAFGRWGMKLGRAPLSGAGLEMGEASADELFQLLKFAALSPPARARG